MLIVTVFFLTAFAVVCTTALLKSSDASRSNDARSAPPVQVGTFLRRTLKFGGHVRAYDVLYPSATLDDVRLPVVFALHCFGCDITTVRTTQPALCWPMPLIRRAQMRYLAPFAEEYRFVLVIPEGYRNSWNARHCCGDALTQKLDDVGFLGAIKQQAPTIQL
jgi:poly(3-hydroxybutyrate) depolymerase